MTWFSNLFRLGYVGNLEEISSSVTTPQIYFSSLNYVMTWFSNLFSLGYVGNLKDFQVQSSIPQNTSLPWMALGFCLFWDILFNLSNNLNNAFSNTVHMLQEIKSKAWRQRWEKVINWELLLLKPWILPITYFEATVLENANKSNYWAYEIKRQRLKTNKMLLSLKFEVQQLLAIVGKQFFHLRKSFTLFS